MIKNIELKDIESLVPDTSVIIEGLVSENLKKLTNLIKIFIHNSVIAELEHQANENKAIGFLGLEELEKLQELCKEKSIELVFAGKRPTILDIRNAKKGDIDDLIRQLANDEDSVLFTADKIQAKVASAKDIKYVLIKQNKIENKIKLESFFDNTTMSVHLRENVLPFAKKGKPGEWEFVSVKKKKISREDIQEISREIIEEAGIRKDGFIELERPGSTIIQLGKFRIVITKPPFSDGWEITAVRPVKQLNLAEYNLSENLKLRIEEQAEGILIAGSPGMGKSTFSQALAEYYADQNKIVKTIEAPRDLILKENVTQYAISHGDAEEIHDILLLSRPDNVLFDEMRNTSDFNLFTDLRLAGIGLAGVVHATAPIDAIQRFVGRIELGVIPHVIDTVIFIKNGQVDKVLSLNMVVKVPAGMTEKDLARPIVVISDFETKKPEFELYSYGEETVVIPVTEKSSKSPSQKIAAKAIEKEFEKYSDKIIVEMLNEHKARVYVPKNKISGIIGKQGKTIDAIEKNIGISLDIEELIETDEGELIPFEYEIKKSKLKIILGKKHKNKELKMYVDDDFLMSVKASNTGEIKISKKNKIGRIIADGLLAGENILIKQS